MRIVVALVLIILTAQPVLARGSHNHHPGAEADGSGDRRGNNAYGKAKVEERGKLIGKLKNMNICRGC
jgi:hypothetical protein